ncbi:hypothetical protein PHYSODRAFT_340173 [Phytophthora sojae]|uniref:Uncharacterized protein n=1 Tax=Phytophthora sojae (strain P6497) TaxID=1094619 RepID=G5A909_PHYSP|nr:hypothetical protein PHYSODRAFT_340173 [Phytophthora sojae]EGZ08385.1 hypothetical protein PHYSODRAFT_340173 [Phytophthora sojae]|eukprot:XP_009536557.1 hypothetical protein PHYSODRAFT_340173 [Phytophthora sojae]
MRVHRAFFAWASQLQQGQGVSAQAKVFAQEELDGAHEAAVTKAWLSNRAGKALRTKWKALTPEERESFLQSTANDTTCDAPVQAPESAADQALAKLLRQRNQLCGSVARAAMSAELAAMAMAVRKRDADGVAESAAAVIECLGAQVAGSFSAGARDILLVLMRDTAAHVSATRSYNLLLCDSEAMEAHEMTRDSAREAVATLRDFTTDYSGVNPRFKEAVDNQVPFNPRYARYLGSLAWQSQLDSGGNAVPVNGSDSSCTGDLGAEPELDEEAASSLHSASDPDLPVPVPNSDGAIADSALSMVVMSDKIANTTPASAHVNSSPRP